VEKLMKKMKSTQNNNKAKKWDADRKFSVCKKWENSEALFPDFWFLKSCIFNSFFLLNC
jgi:hypothetical protein